MFTEALSRKISVRIFATHLVPQPFLPCYKFLSAQPTLYASASQPPGRGPVVGPGINYTGP
jgi:hypothetical protein